METIEYFTILDSVDSTNNYAMAKLHAGLAKHGMAWFAMEQTSGKGQRGKEWISQPGENIVLSIIIAPPNAFSSQPFGFNALIANTCHAFLNKYVPGEINIKWPNDLYLRDRKAGGILIENIYQGTAWKWSVVGIGINLNQMDFSDKLRNPVSLRQVTGAEYDTIEMAKELYSDIIREISAVEQPALPQIIEVYNQHLYLLNKKVRLRKQNIVFETNITGVNINGQLLTNDSLPRHFDFGEVEWIL